MRSLAESGSKITARSINYHCFLVLRCLQLVQEGQWVRGCPVRRVGLSIQSVQSVQIALVLQEVHLHLHCQYFPAKPMNK
jgi:hypothetical protein